MYIYASQLNLTVFIFIFNNLYNYALANHRHIALECAPQTYLVNELSRLQPYANTNFHNHKYS